MPAGSLLHSERNLSFLGAVYYTLHCTWQVALSHNCKMHALSSMRASVSHNSFFQGSQGFRVLQIVNVPQTSGRPPAGGFHQALLLMLCSFKTLSSHRGPRRALAPGLLGLLGVLPLLASGLCGPPNTGCM